MAVIKLKKAVIKVGEPIYEVLDFLLNRLSQLMRWHWSLNHVKRNYNRVAHELAQEARRREDSKGKRLLLVWGIGFFEKN
nr:hypothetical protein CFP56_71375 [Quercus suber]